MFGLDRMLSSLLGTAIFREYSPALASVMVAAQAGSSIAARVGTMKVRGQIDALAVMSLTSGGAGSGCPVGTYHRQSSGSASAQRP